MYTIFIKDGHGFTARLAAMRSNRLAEILSSADINTICNEPIFIVFIFISKLIIIIGKKEKKHLLESAGDQLQT